MDKAQKVDPAVEVLQAKVRFCKAMEDLGPAKFIQTHPLAATGSAFAFGLGLRLLLKKASPATLLPIFLEAGVAVGKSLLNSSSRRP